MKPIFDKLLFLAFCILSWNSFSQNYHLTAKWIFDGKDLQENWSIHVQNEKITYAGPFKKYPKAELIDFPNGTLMPGLIEGHSHILLHPYNETPWNDQVLKESYGERAARAVNHCKASLMAGVTTMRDLGSEGAGYLDVGIKQAIEKGVIPGPRLIVAGPAIVATGSYGPKGFHDMIKVPLGAEEADISNIVQVVRRQIGKGADFIKVYADYRWGPNREARPTFSTEEIRLIVETAASSGRVTVAHAATKEGMMRAIKAGVTTIEHGDELDQEVANLMKARKVALYPTLAAVESISKYRGWKKGKDPDPETVTQKKQSFKTALTENVTTGFGGDVGVYTHGENVIELELMAEYGMQPKKVLEMATSGNAEVFDLSNLGQLKTGFLADIIAVDGNPLEHISALRKVKFVMKNGNIYKKS